MGEEKYDMNEIALSLNCSFAGFHAAFLHQRRVLYKLTYIF